MKGNFYLLRYRQFVIMPLLGAIGVDRPRRVAAYFCYSPDYALKLCRFYQDAFGHRVLDHIQLHDLSGRKSMSDQFAYVAFVRPRQGVAQNGEIEVLPVPYKLRDFAGTLDRNGVEAQNLKVCRT
jgi:hypothetical protein